MSSSNTVSAQASRITFRLSEADLENIATINRLVAAGPLAKRDASSTIRYAISLAAAALQKTSGER